ncbi:hypothetical protein JW887_00935 [Candidatus Dojkabacteria bacterium]|nr:hypothetical protein [Candidatus Dojkabacteria bacterium]
MKKSDFGTLLALVAGLVIAFLLVDNVLKKIKIAELQKEIDENENLTKEIRNRLKELMQNEKEVDPRIANELGQMIALLEIKQDTSAIFKLAKILENLLKELYKNDKELRILAESNGRKNPAFADYLQHAKNNKLISSEDFHLLSVLKIIRNEEAHDLDVHKERSRILAAFVAGIGLVLSLCAILKKKTIETT